MHGTDLARVASRLTSQIRCVLADSEDPFTVELLAGRFATTLEDLRERIHAARADYPALRRENGAIIDIRYRAGDRTCSLYRFDDTAILSLYSRAAPVFVSRRRPRCTTSSPPKGHGAG